VKLLPTLAYGMAAGMLMGLSMPPVPWGLLAWGCLLPLLVAVEKARRPFPAFAGGLVCGLVFFTACTSWTALVMSGFGGLSMLEAAPIAGLLIAYLSLFPALFSLLLYAGRRRLPRSWPLLAPFLWAGTEYLRTTVLTGFPWCLLGYSQYSFLAAAQPASLGGVYLVSALVVLGSVLLYALLRRDLVTVGATGAVIAIALAAGAVAVPHPSRGAEGELRVGVVQPGTPALLDSDRVLEETMKRHLELTRSLPGCDLIVWPENSLVRGLTSGGFQHEIMAGAAAEVGCPILVNTIEYAGQDVFNSALLVRPDGSLSPRYDKMHLVPFGEYVPLSRVLFFAGKFLQEVSDFSAGDRRILFDVRGIRFGSAICYEIIYPDEVAAFAREGAEFLVTQSNDTWYAGTVMPYQHHAMAVFRAIENRRYLVRATNSGISSIVDPAGRVTRATPVGGAAAFRAAIGVSSRLSPYTRSHDAFALVCVVVAAGVALSAMPVGRLRRKSRVETMQNEKCKVQNAK